MPRSVPNKARQNYINHIVLVLDASGSMGIHKAKLIQVADDQIAYLAQRSKELDQETRVTVYIFDDVVECVIYDKDVLRLPSIAEHYRLGGMTALVEATLKALDDLAETPERYGDHAFLLYVLTDGLENASNPDRRRVLPERLAALPDHWTVAALVPDQRGVFEAKKFGFPADNISVWDATSSSGIVEAGTSIRTATDTFMTNRSVGIRGSRSVFAAGGAAAVNKAAIRATGVRATPSTRYLLMPVIAEGPIKEFVEGHGHGYRTGKAFYQLSKTEKIQGNKALALREKKTDKVFMGSQVRALLGLGDESVRVKPDLNPDYEIFVQSTSVNRKLVPSTRLLLLLV